METCVRTRVARIEEGMSSRGAKISSPWGAVHVVVVRRENAFVH